MYTAQRLGMLSVLGTVGVRNTVHAQGHSKNQSWKGILP